MSFILADACAITMNADRDILDRGSVLIEGDRIASIGARAQLVETHSGAEVIDAAGQILIPGMVNTHTHLFQTLLKGPGDDMVLKKWFTCMTGPAAVELTASDAHAAALHGCVESIRSGVTTLVDFMYVHPRPGLTQVVFDAYEATAIWLWSIPGVRSCRRFTTRSRRSSTRPWGTRPASSSSTAGLCFETARCEPSMRPWCAERPRSRLRILPNALRLPVRHGPGPQCRYIKAGRNADAPGLRSDIGVDERPILTSPAITT